jgi:hypothetical protein
LGSVGLNCELDERFLLLGEAFSSALARSRSATAEKYCIKSGPIYSALTAAFSCLASIAARPDRAVAPAEAKAKVRRAAIHLSIVQGVHAVEYCIEHGLYPQAAALVRQEMEAAEGLRGIRLGLQKDKETPRLKALRHLGKAYRQLTGLAHLSDHAILSHVTDLLGTGFDHTFNEKFSEFLLCLHLSALVGVALDMAELRPFIDTAKLAPQEEAWLQCICGLLDELGFMKPMAKDQPT